MRYHKEHILGEIRRLFRRLFPERQIFFRSRGQVRFLRLSPTMQACAASAIAAVLLWTGAATLTVLTRDTRLDAKEREIAYTTRELGALMGELARLEEEALSRTAILEARQSLIERAAGPVAAESGVTIPYLPARIDAPDDTVPAADARQKGAFLLPEGERNLTGSVIGATSAEAVEPITSVLVSVRLDHLLARLDLLETRQMQAALALAIDEAMAVDERRAVLARLGLSLETLVGADRISGAAMGGPFIADLPETPVEAFSLLSERAGTRAEIDRIFRSMPATVPVEKYYVSSGFGRRIDPFHKTRAMHGGLDMAGWAGEPILAAGVGKVVKSGRAPAYGNMIEIDHGNGFRTRYGHMRKLLVKVGEQVTAGQKIGEMGASGRATSTHLHWEVWFRGKLLDPQPFIEASEDVHALQQDSRRYEKG